MVVFDHKRDACDQLDIPDAPARAIRTKDGRVELFAPHFANRRLIGSDLLRVVPGCGVVYAGAESADPSAFDDRGWIAAPYTADGQHIAAVIHNEFQGHRHPGLCPTGRYMDCWYNALTLAISSDSGAHFSRPQSALIASVPYRYDEIVGAHRGYFSPSNIVSTADGFAMFVFATQARAQRPGNCLLRTRSLNNAGAWRGWNGHDFAVRFVDPYRESGDLDSHVCAPVAPQSLRWPVTSLVLHEPTGRFIALMMNGKTGVYASVSTDLITWSDPTLIFKARGPNDWICGDETPMAYPSLLDPASRSRSFESVGYISQLYLTRFNPSNCKLGMDRDLIRFPVAINIRDRP